jgi:periplasmic divalent cation tolerance protein
VSERLAACVNRIPGVHSTFLWEGRLQEDEEILLIIKTSADRLATLSARIQALHPYEVPEVVAVGIAGGSERYLSWLGQSVGAA